MEKKVYTVTDIQTILGLSRTKAYDFIKMRITVKIPSLLSRLIVHIVYLKIDLMNGSIAIISKTKLNTAL